jgi:hypothetical protein
MLMRFPRQFGKENRNLVFVKILNGAHHSFLLIGDDKAGLLLNNGKDIVNSRKQLPASFGLLKEESIH